MNEEIRRFRASITRSAAVGRLASPLPVTMAQQLALTSDVAARVCLAVTLGLGTFVRLWQINSVGYNSDEVVYAGQAAAIANDPELTPFFPVFRAHPMLFQFVLSLGFRFGVSDLFGRLVSVAVGIATVYLVYHLGHVLYGRWAGVIAALLMAVMPYHVVVTRQVLLDGPMTFFTTLTIYLVARFAVTQRPALLYATGASLGLTFLAKETGFVVIVAVYAFLALTPAIRVRIRDLTLSLAVMVLTIAPHPVSVALAGRTETAKGYLVWQLFRRSNHEWTFFPTVVPPAIGFLTIAAAGLGLWLLRRERSWRETLLLAWILIPAVVFQLWPVKGFQYLLPIAPPIAVLAGRTLALWRPGGDLGRERRWDGVAWLRPVAVGVVVLTLLVPMWQRIQPSTSAEFLAGSGGIPGGREAGAWIRDNVPHDAMFLTVGPSMANIVQFYGHRKAYGLSVSSNPLHRNPSYEPIRNPDLLIRTSELQYLVYDTFSASRSPFFGDQLLNFAETYHGRIVHTESVEVLQPDGTTVATPIIVIFEVRP